MQESWPVMFVCGVSWRPLKCHRRYFKVWLFRRSLLTGERGRQKLAFFPSVSVRGGGSSCASMVSLLILQHLLQVSVQTFVPGVPVHCFGTGNEKFTLHHWFWGLSHWYGCSYASRSICHLILCSREEYSSARIIFIFFLKNGLCQAMACHAGGSEGWAGGQCVFFVIAVLAEALLYGQCLTVCRTW